ncbi:hypothetical protein [Streptomyces catenulae]|uniref:Uncharacterized protein n=1 Tax=Streptomyces catenulae TaxID=66875 RepID=A0ABV2Z1I7_9ACTN|nr:hypothetical protein [Streptomyces catenulae]
MFHSFVLAPQANINNGTVHGGQHAENRIGGPSHGERLVESHEGPVSSAEIDAAEWGFAEPEWFEDALRELDSGLLFLTGEAGVGRRTVAINLLLRHSDSRELRAVDRDVNLAAWRPGKKDAARGYLVDGLIGQQPLGRGTVGALKRMLEEARARMVVVLPDEPELVRGLMRDLDLTPRLCAPPPPRAVFDARFAAAVPEPAARSRLLASLETGVLDELLANPLVPSEVAELVETVVESGEGPSVPGATDLRSRLSYRACDEAPELVKKAREDPDALAFLLALCVFEGLDHRIVREQAERLLELAEGRLDPVLRDGGREESTGCAVPPPTGPNPKFVFRRSLDELMRKVRAESAQREIRTGTGYRYSVEPVRFTRHRQAEEVLKHVWRQYSQLPALLTDWMDGVGGEHELTRSVGRVMGLAVGWGGGRRALDHIHGLAASDRASSRSIAAAALGMAAQDPMLDGEIKYRLRAWSRSSTPLLRSTVARTCGTEFGLSRPEFALQTLRAVRDASRRRRAEPDADTAETDVRRAVVELFSSGNQTLVMRHLVEWDSAYDDGDFVQGLFPWLFPGGHRWLGEQLVSNGEFAEFTIALTHRALDDDALFEHARNMLVAWCRSASWDDEPEPTGVLLTALAQRMTRGVFRLFVDIDQFPDPLPVHALVRHALESWRHGRTPTDPGTTAQRSAV